jgi:gas vesicle protein
MSSNKAMSFVSFLTGAAVGAVVALLYAPTSGEELRSQIREEADTRWQMVTTEFDNAVSSMQQSLEETRKEVLALVEEALSKEAEEAVAEETPEAEA